MKCSLIFVINIGFPKWTESVVQSEGYVLVSVKVYVEGERLAQKS
jgi:hypothetical protein